MIMEFIKANMIVILGIGVPVVVIFCLAVLITIFVRRKTSSNDEEASDNSTVNLDDSVKPYPIWRSPAYQPTPMLQATANIFSSFVPTPLPPPALMQVVSPTGASIKTSVLTPNFTPPTPLFRVPISNVARNTDVLPSDTVFSTPTKWLSPVHHGTRACDSFRTLQFKRASIAVVSDYLSPARLGIKRASTFGRGDARFMSHRYTVK